MKGMGDRIRIRREYAAIQVVRQRRFELSHFVDRQIFQLGPAPAPQFMRELRGLPRLLFPVNKQVSGLTPDILCIGIFYQLQPGIVGKIEKRG